ncbi:flavocytochrome c [Inediibacterium massiliense]|uniref:flavocytochrome c n=1 Tax=Inediibacterium massiliense TaxID=1658111 RepID=UPI0006B5746C|nr:flavocytochrome c [Inediibacterium massiliense]
MKKQTKEILIFLIIGFLLTLFVIGYRHMRDHPSVELEGKYIGESMGKNGKVQVALSIENNEIINIEILKNNESSMGQKVFSYISKQVIEKNSADIDDVAGATQSSQTIKAAIEDAIKKSGISIVPITSTKKNKINDIHTDIVVVGSGGAGLTSAIEAKEKGAQVLLVEKLPILGGNTKYATGGINASGTAYQKEKGIQDHTDLFIKDTLEGGQNTNNKSLVKILAQNSSSMINWLTNYGMDLSDVGRLGGASVDRAHRPKGGAPVGEMLFSTLEKTARSKGVEIRTGSKATKILFDNNKVTGIEVQNLEGNTYKIYAKGVIIATGGFGANKDMVSSYRKDLKEFGTTNSPGATGDGINLLETLNSSIIDMTEIQIHPTVVFGTNYMITEAVRGNGAILINQDGKRFVNELDTRDVVSQNILAQKEKAAFLIFDENVRKSLKAIDDYDKEGLLIKGKTLKELGQNLKINENTLQKTLTTYNTYVEKQEDHDFHRSSLQTKIEQSNFYGIKVSPAIHYTMGGVKINEKAQVIDNNGKIIKNLYAAGEVTGGVHGKNRLGGNSLADILVFGKIAADTACEEIK